MSKIDKGRFRQHPGYERRSVEPPKRRQSGIDDIKEDLSDGDTLSPQPKEALKFESTSKIETPTFVEPAQVTRLSTNIEDNAEPTTPSVSTRKIPVWILLVSVLLVIILVGLAVLIFSGSKHPPKPKNTTSHNNPAGLNFTPLTPPGESQLAHLGSKAFNAQHDSYFFGDLFLGFPIQVSEQPLPKGISSTASAVSKLANNLHATYTISTDSGTAYLYNNLAQGKQTVVCSKDGLIIFIESSNLYSDTDWQTYINDLQ